MTRPTYVLPELRGTLKPYRIYTIGSGLPRHAFPPYGYGSGPSTVALPEWSVSYTTSDSGEGCTLSARKSDGSIGPGRFHALSGTVYRDVEAATTAAYDAGLIGIMLYEAMAVRDGLGLAA